MNLSERVRAFVALSGLCLVWVLSCDKEEVLDGRMYGISGVVTDSVHDVPIDSARITRYDTSDVSTSWWTDSTGSYTVPVRGGTFTVFVRKEGYNTKSLLLVNISTDTSGVDFQLVPLK